MLGLAIGEEILPIERAKPLDAKELNAVILSRSFELRQMDALIQIAHLQKSELYFNWLDPSGDYNANLGFGLGDTIASSESKIKELLVRREQLQTQVVSKAYSMIEEFNQALEVYVRVSESTLVQERRLSRVIDLITKDPELNTMDVAEIFRDAMEAKVRQYTNLADFRVARARVDRFLLQGYYLSLPQMEKDLMKKGPAPKKLP